MDLFGRKELKKTIEQLRDQLEQQQDKIDRLQDRLEKESDRAREAARKKQDVEEERNRLQDRVRSLEDRIGQEQDDDTPLNDADDLTLRQVEDIIQNLGRIEYATTEAHTVYRSGDSLLESETGEAVFLDPHLIRVALIPPLALDPTRQKARTFDMEPIEQLLQGRYLYIHLTSGGSGACIIDGQDVEDAVTVTADIKSQHKKGGYSQKRFERAREEQIQEHLDAFLDATDELRERGFDRMIVAGNKRLQDALLDEIDMEGAQLRSNISKIEDEDDLVEGFNSAMSFKIVHLSRQQFQESLSTF